MPEAGPGRRNPEPHTTYHHHHRAPGSCANTSAAGRVTLIHTLTSKRDDRAPLPAGDVARALAVVRLHLALTFRTDVGFTGRVRARLAIVVALWAVFYRNIKGLWFGRLYAAHRLGADSA